MKRFTNETVLGAVRRISELEKENAELRKQLESECAEHIAFMEEAKKKVYELEDKLEEVETQFDVESDYVGQLLGELGVTDGSVDDGINKIKELKENALVLPLMGRKR